MTDKKQAQPNFEKQLKTLETIIADMEKGGLSLEASLEKFEQGIGLSRECQTALKAAEQKVQILVEKNKQFVLDDFSNDE